MCHEHLFHYYTDEYPRRTKSATRLSSRRSRRLFSEGAVTSTLTDTGSSPRQQMLLRRVLRSRDSRRSNKDEGNFPSPTTDYRRLGSVRSYESSISIARKERDAVGFINYLYAFFFKLQLSIWKIYGGDLGI